MACVSTVALLLAGCTLSRDTRTPAERERDAELWTRAHALQVSIAQDQLRGCAPLGVVSEHYYEDVPHDPMKRPMGMPWPEYVLRFKTAELGGNAALMNRSIDKWDGQLNQWRLLGEAYLCRQPASTTASR